MIEHRRGSLFDQRDLNYLAHQCNLFQTFGSGIAKEIKTRFPWAHAADCRTWRGDRSRLGGSLLVYAPNTKWPINGIFNLYCQDGISATNRTTHYAAMGKIFFELEAYLRERKEDPTYRHEDLVLGLPHGIGCGLAGGDWKVVLPIIESAFGNSPVKVVICKL